MNNYVEILLRELGFVLCMFLFTTRKGSRIIFLAHVDCILKKRVQCAPTKRSNQNG